MSLTNEQRDCIDNTGKQFRAVLIAYKGIDKFSVDTYMIKKTKQLNYQSKFYWRISKFGSGNHNRKYKVISIDEFGIPFYKKVLYNGKLHSDLKYMGNLDMRFTKFYVDPEMQDYVILGGDPDKFDPMKTYRDERKKK